MARGNFWRSLAAASLIVASGAAGMLAVSSLPAGAVDNIQITVYVTDNGFSQTNLSARVGDLLVFQLDGGARNAHTLAWEGGQIQFRFQNGDPNRMSVKYGPLRQGPTIRFYDADSVSGPDVKGPFAGTLTVTNAPPPPPDTTSSSTSTTVTTVRPTTTTTGSVPVTSTTSPPTPATTGDATIHPFLLADPAPAPAPTTTTTTAPAATKKDPPADKGKAKAASAATPTTASPAPAAPAPVEPIFDPATLTPAALPQPDGAASAAADPAGGPDLGAEAVASLLNPDKPADNGTPMMLAAMVGLGLLLVAGAVWSWHHRASRYFPA
jgi:hypothetical protein